MRRLDDLALGVRSPWDTPPCSAADKHLLIHRDDWTADRAIVDSATVALQVACSYTY